MGRVEDIQQKYARNERHNINYIYMINDSNDNIYIYIIYIYNHIDTIYALCM